VKYYFLSGIPRAGNTILSSILNQNKDIGVSANSIISETLFKLNEWKKHDIAFNNFPDVKSYDSMMASILPSYYSEWNCKYVIDRSAWGTPYNFSLLQKYCPNDIKIICLVRNIEDVFCSWIDWCNKNPDNYINRSTNIGTIEEKFNYLINPQSQIVREVLSANTLIQGDQNNEHHIIVDYDNMIDDPKKEIERIYKFLNIPPYDHNFTSIGQFSSNGIKYDDSCLGNNLHMIRSNGVLKRDYQVDIPKHLIDRCSDLNVWKIK
tara:strand:- start:4708 stop:5499 length:792 start_codon:yes stop_codon:yes gene_type:complete